MPEQEDTEYHSNNFYFLFNQNSSSRQIEQSSMLVYVFFHIFFLFELFCFSLGNESNCKFFFSFNFDTVAFAVKFLFNRYALSIVISFSTDYWRCVVLFGCVFTYRYIQVSLTVGRWLRAYFPPTTKTTTITMATNTTIQINFYVPVITILFLFFFGSFSFLSC